MPCTNPPNYPNHLTLNCLGTIPLPCHATSATLILLTTQMTTIILVNTAALVVARAVVHTALIAMMMIATASVPLIITNEIH